MLHTKTVLSLLFLLVFRKNTLAQHGKYLQSGETVRNKLFWEKTVWVHQVMYVNNGTFFRKNQFTSQPTLLIILENIWYKLYHICMYILSAKDLNKNWKCIIDDNGKCAVWTKLYRIEGNIQTLHYFVQI